MKRHEKQPSADVRPRFPSRGAGLGLLAPLPEMAVRISICR